MTLLVSRSFVRIAELILRWPKERYKMPTEMFMVQTGNDDHVWECSNCFSYFKDTEKFKTSEQCPKCKEHIIDWIDEGE